MLGLVRPKAAWAGARLAIVADAVVHKDFAMRVGMD